MKTDPLNALKAVAPPVAPGTEPVYPVFYFTDEESERLFWEQVAADWPEPPPDKAR